MSTATAQDAILVRSESDLLARIMGTRAPSTIPAPSALAMNVSCFASMFPASRSGTIMMSGSPETSDLIPFISAASLFIALSNASGPSSIAPVIWPLSAILQRAAASSVERILDVTVSTAESMATLGLSIPSMCARSMAFLHMSALSSSPGYMFIAASVIISVLWYVGTSIMYAWLSLLSVLRPVSCLTTSVISSSVCRLPFMRTVHSPSLTSLTASAAEAWLWGVFTILSPVISMPFSAAVFLILSSGPTSTGSMRSSFQAVTTALSEDSSQGCATAVRGVSSSAHFSMKRSYLLYVLTIISGPSVSGMETFSTGAITVALPVITVSPF